MAELAQALQHTDDAATYAAEADRARLAFQAVLFDPAKGLYRDGEGTDHTSQHANLFPLAFALVPAEHRAQVTAWVAARGMRCSVYAAQYLLEGLFDHGNAAEALALITAPGKRSWRHMVESGTTITWEAWDQSYKPNQDWNHAWGAAPANLFPRKLLGVEPLTPGYRQIQITPRLGSLTSARGKIPTPQGPVLVAVTTTPAFTLKVDIPPGTSARLSLPLPATAGGASLLSNGKPLPATAKEGRLVADQAIGPGRYELQIVTQGF
jgi:hypothetical protein